HGAVFVVVPPPGRQGTLMMPGLDSRDVWLPRYTSLGAGEMAERRKQKKRSQVAGAGNWMRLRARGREEIQAGT
ncbi:hypothetical protein chiPu_0027180, partial [Chiloscyllium punctatum]|nr:hypothetical protein [Chiloscyllium punctatum]